MINYCAACGSPVEERIPPKDHVTRPVCGSCGYVHYINPKIVVGCVAQWADGRILLCRRSIKPRLGLWTFPSGFLECGESAEAGAAREALEEADARLKVEGLLCVIDVPQISQVHLIYRATLLSPAIGVTAESDVVALLSEAEVPWEHLAFSTVTRSLRYYFADRAAGTNNDVHQIALGSLADRSEFMEQV
jgi:ADP-ribose pyrophosphatase YjhB (NUDIX family)